ncbi:MULTISPECIES: ROK family transcriptional regulator [unclassified Leptolyngbya]|uniref:ROK family transcriptional regulator n=1 Tax=unclassified Leptolyngbya TaxID=2650499 RepID=UPI001683C2D7|nr:MULTISPECIES: ROK family transcriptional regulator [unclassified Leptolyngbya]MBD1909078.1 ROK family transcriptional regulator [Leptolyngbya sp. FACHB-8]MBD2157011.1 ROK family transcriptional regulator [Leptolyngbya sp. FACHB-16]
MSVPLTSPFTTHPAVLKQFNTARLLELLRCRAPIARAELARLTGLTRSTVTVITAELIAQGLIQEGIEITASRGSRGSGRPGVGLMLNPDGAFFVGAAIEAEHLTVIKLNLAAQIVARLQQPVSSTDPESVLRQLVQLIHQVCQAEPYNRARLRGIGLSVQGVLNLEGVVIRAPFLDWSGVDLRRYLQPHLDLPLFVDNDANAAALAEVYLGNAMQSSCLLYILINNGIGSGLIINNRVFRGAYGTAGEISALMSDPPGQDNAYECGHRVGKDDLLKRYRALGGKAEDLRELVERLEEDAIAHSTVQEWGNILGRGLISVASLLNPEQIILGGPLSILFPYVQGSLMDQLRNRMPRQGEQGFFSNPKARLAVSAFGEDAAVVGGAVLAYQSLFQVPDLVL